LARQWGESTKLFKTARRNESEKTGLPYKRFDFPVISNWHLSSGRKK
jgi:hypothetical protein